MAKSNNVKIKIPKENDYVIKSLELYGRSIYKNPKLHKHLSTKLKDYSHKELIYFNTQKKMNIITIKPGYQLKKSNDRIRIYRTWAKKC